MPGAKGLRGLAGQFLRFGTVGAGGFVVDTAVVYGLRGAVGLYLAGLASYVAAASFNWLLNRLWTFRGAGGGSALRQWARFMVANLAGFALNRGTFWAMVGFVPLAVEWPVLAVLAGTAAGMFVNFGLSRLVVFR
jgi:hypothetical protein